MPINRKEIKFDINQAKKYNQSELESAKLEHQRNLRDGIGDREETQQAILNYLALRLRNQAHQFYLNLYQFCDQHGQNWHDSIVHQSLNHEDMEFKHFLALQLQIWRKLIPITWHTQIEYPDTLYDQMHYSFCGHLGLCINQLDKRILNQQGNFTLFTQENQYAELLHSNKITTLYTQGSKYQLPGTVGVNTNTAIGALILLELKEFINAILDLTIKWYVKRSNNRFQDDIDDITAYLKTY